MCQVKKKQLAEINSLLLPYGSRRSTQVIRFDSKHLFLLSYLAGPERYFQNKEKYILFFLVFFIALCRFPVIATIFYAFGRDLSLFVGGTGSLV